MWGKPHAVGGTAQSIAEGLASSDWQRLSAGECTPGPRWHDWAYLELADLEVSEFGADELGLRTCGLLIRRPVAGGELAFFSNRVSGWNAD